MEQRQDWSSQILRSQRGVSGELLILGEISNSPRTPANTAPVMPSLQNTYAFENLINQSNSDLQRPAHRYPNPHDSGRHSQPELRQSNIRSTEQSNDQLLRHPRAGL